MTGCACRAVPVEQRVAGVARAGGVSALRGVRVYRTRHARYAARLEGIARAFRARGLGLRRHEAIITRVARTGTQCFFMAARNTRRAVVSAVTGAARTKPRIAIPPHQRRVFWASSTLCRVVRDEPVCTGRAGRAIRGCDCCCRYCRVPDAAGIARGGPGLRLECARHAGRADQLARVPGIAPTVILCSAACRTLRLHRTRHTLRLALRALPRVGAARHAHTTSRVRGVRAGRAP